MLLSLFDFDFVVAICDKVDCFIVFEDVVSTVLFGLVFWVTFDDQDVIVCLCLVLVAEAAGRVSILLFWLFDNVLSPLFGATVFWFQLLLPLL